MQNPADDATVIHTILAAYIRRQIRLNRTPLLIAQPKQVAPHLPGSRIIEPTESITDSTSKAFIECEP